MSASDKPRLAGRQPSNRGGVPRVKTWPVDASRRSGKRGELLSRTDPSVRGPGRHDDIVNEDGAPVIDTTQEEQDDR